MKTHRLSIRQSLLLLAAALTTSNGGCSCGLGVGDGSLYCPVFDNSVTEVSYYCSVPPQIIGKTNATLLIAKPSFYPVSDQGYYFLSTQIYSVALDGSSKLIDEIDFAPQVMAANEDYLAWVDYYQSKVTVRDLRTREDWIAVQAGWSESVSQLELVGNH